MSGAWTSRVPVPFLGTVYVVRDQGTDEARVIGSFSGPSARENAEQACAAVNALKRERGGA